MKLSQCTYGKLVEGATGKVWGVGMVRGITQNSVGEAIPLVQWQDEDVPRGVHYNNLRPYEG